MSTGYLVTIQQMVDATLRKLGVNIQGGTATSTEVTEAIMAFNLMAKRFFTLGMPSYREYTYTINPLVQGTSSYSITPDTLAPLGGVMDVYQAYLNNPSTNIRIPMRVIPKEEYNSYTNPTQQGIPVAVMIEPDGQTARLYLTPDAQTAANNTVLLLGYKQQDTYTAGSDNVAFPQEWYEALLYGLCWRLAPEYGLDLDTTKMFKGLADEALADAVNWSPEMNSTYFGINNYGRK